MKIQQCSSSQDPKITREIQSLSSGGLHSWREIWKITETEQIFTCPIVKERNKGKKKMFPLGQSRDKLMGKHTERLRGEHRTWLWPSGASTGRVGRRKTQGTAWGEAWARSLQGHAQEGERWCSARRHVRKRDWWKVKLEIKGYSQIMNTLHAKLMSWILSYR